MSKETRRLHLEMKGARATILPRRGGLLASLTLKANGKSRELLWMSGAFDPEESGWPGGGAPLLFPFAGRVFLAGQPLKYNHAGQTFDMPLHGFAYAMPWTVAQVTAGAATLSLVSNASSERLYPFSFELRAHYELEPERLKITVEVISKSNEPMPVALGLHPFFRMPLGTGTMSECLLVTSASEKIAVTPAGGAGKSSPWVGAPQGVSLTEQGLANLILGGHATPWGKLLDPNDSLAVKVAWPSADVRYAVSWHRPNEGFHCLEPWMGLPDAIATGAGLKWLGPGETLKVPFAISLETMPS